MRNLNAFRATAGLRAAHPAGLFLVALGVAGCGTLVSSTAAPAGIEWLDIPGPAGTTHRAAVARPSTGSTPRPVLVLLHGTHGFAQEYVTLARVIAADAGIVVVAACWFAGRRGAGVASITPIECPSAPPMPDSANSSEAVAVVGGLVDAARTLPGVRSDRVVLLGHSRGGVAALYYALERGRGAAAGVRAVVLNSTAYPPSLLSRAAELEVPALLLHGTADSPVRGGSPMTAVARARAFEAALRGSAKVVRAEYYEGAEHDGLFEDAAQRLHSVQAVTAFLRQQGFE